MNIKHLSLALFLSIFTLSCSEETENDSTMVSAKIIFEGDPATDGCGWLTSVEDTLYKPINLPEEFKIDNYPVLINYQKLSSKTCNWWSLPNDSISGITEISITNIKKINNEKP